MSSRTQDAINEPGDATKLAELLDEEVRGRSMEPDAIRVLLLIARRLNHGRELYGDMDIRNSPRNFNQEALEEDADGLVYRAAETLRQM